MTDHVHSFLWTGERATVYETDDIDEVRCERQ